MSVTGASCPSDKPPFVTKNTGGMKYDPEAGLVTVIGDLPAPATPTEAELD